MRRRVLEITLATRGVFLSLVVAGGCDSAIKAVNPDAATSGDDGASATGFADATPCRIDKIAFSQTTGCQNDGSVEFCLPAGDERALAQARGIDSTVVCHQGASGRAGCDVQAEQLCQLPIQRTQCSMEEPMPDALWLTVCRLAELDAIAKVVPTWYE